jgi:hypothetical protein
MYWNRYESPVIAPLSFHKRNVQPMFIGLPTTRTNGDQTALRADLPFKIFGLIAFSKMCFRSSLQ